jgi:uncharacterized protein
MTGELTAFLNDKSLGVGEAADLVRLISSRPPAERSAIRVYDDASGRVVDLDFRALPPFGSPSEPPKARGRGRPKLGVTAREVTLLPRHWDWLAAQPGGASAALRRLVEAARQAPPTPEARRDSAYRFMADHCGDRPGFEEALRALYRGQAERFDELIADWPTDIRAYIAKLLG